MNDMNEIYLSANEVRVLSTLVADGEDPNVKVRKEEFDTHVRFWASIDGRPEIPLDSKEPRSFRHIRTKGSWVYCARLDRTRSYT